MRKLFIIFISLIFTSCCTSYIKEYKEIECPNEVCDKVIYFAELYKESCTEYKLGSQDSLIEKPIFIDCSGLVIMCYKYSLVDTDYELYKPDMLSKYIYDNASYKKDIDSMRKGDLIFMGEIGTEKVTHIAIFNGVKDCYIYFIDSTQKDIDNNGSYEINGVTERCYKIGDSRFKSFGSMKLLY